MLLLDKTKSEDVMGDAWRTFLTAFKRLLLTWVQQKKVSSIRYAQRLKSPNYYGCVRAIMQHSEDPRVAFFYREDGEYDVSEDEWVGFLEFIAECNARLDKNFFYSHRHPLKYSISTPSPDKKEMRFGNVEMLAMIVLDVIDHTPVELIPTLITEHIIPAQRDDVLDLIDRHTDGPKFIYQLDDQQQIDHEEDGQK